ncbi:MAG TPA: hypothetical protein VN764_11740 [Polyangiaceae bacterium]|nr:hypothetical protein [Polyangiaceae bacterium]
MTERSHPPSLRDGVGDVASENGERSHPPSLRDGVGDVASEDGRAQL